MVASGENSGVEFTRHVTDDHALAKHLIAFANLHGGRVLLGRERPQQRVEDREQAGGVDVLDRADALELRDLVHQPGRPNGCGRRRSPIATCAGRVG